MFRDDVHSCLLGTDAIRDGVDVPGEALRLIVFDRVPWLAGDPAAQSCQSLSATPMMTASRA